MKFLRMGKDEPVTVYGVCLHCTCAIECFPDEAKIDFPSGSLYIRCPYCRFANILLSPDGGKRKP